MNLLSLFQLGGFMMWPLLACSVLLVAVLFERVVVLGIGAWFMKLRLSEQTLTFHRRVLPFFRDVPPSLGLLGTVIGVVLSFNLTGGPLRGQDVGSGLAVACMTTIFGLSIAVVASVSGYLFDAVIGPVGRDLETPPPTGAQG